MRHRFILIALLLVASLACRGEGCRECKPLEGAKTTLADIEASIERRKNNKYEGGNKLTMGAPCGEYETAHVSNGFAGHTYYLKDGVVVGISYSADNGDANCEGFIPSCGK